MSRLTPLSRLLILLALAAFFGFVFSCCRYEQDASDTAFKEFSASAMLKKYEKFKDMLAKMDERKANIMVFDEQIKELKADSEIDNAEKSYQLSLLTTERMGAVASYNMIAAEYNSAMSKFNYRFTNVGDLPASNLEPLPREVANYMTK